MYLPIPYKITYDTKKFPFRELISNMMEINVDSGKFTSNDNSSINTKTKFIIGEYFEKT
jgi:hypothetical protein